MDIPIALVFREIDRPHRFADIMVKRHDAAFERIGSDCFGRRFREVGDHHRMVVGAR